jgi:hypothetical protein
MGSRRSSRSASDARRGFALAITIALALAPARAAFAVDKAACVEAHADAQGLRRDGKLRAAQEKLLACAAEGCPAPVRADCGRWIEEVRAQQPTVIFAAKDATGADLIAVRVRVDGASSVESLDGKEIAIDPGAHAIAFEKIDDGRVVETTVVLKESEKARVVSVSFASTSSSSPSATSERGPLPWIFVGVGVVALGSFAYFGIRGRSQLNDLESTCAPRCDPSDRDSVHTKLLVADVSLGFALVSFGVASWLFIRKPAPIATDVGVAPVRGGAIAAWGGTF